MKGIVSLLTVFLLVTISILWILPLEIYIIKDVSKLFHIEFITALPKEVLFGSLLIIGLLKLNIRSKDIFNTKNKTEEDEDEYGLLGLVKSLITKGVFVLGLLLCWWFSYLAHSWNNF